MFPLHYHKLGWAFRLALAEANKWFTCSLSLRCHAGLAFIKSFHTTALYQNCILFSFMNCHVEMCAERNGKKWERERNWKERVSFLSRSYKFWPAHICTANFARRYLCHQTLIFCSVFATDSSLLCASVVSWSVWIWQVLSELGRFQAGSRDVRGNEREKTGTGKKLERTRFFPFPFLQILTSAHL